MKKAKGAEWIRAFYSAYKTSIAQFTGQSRHWSDHCKRLILRRLALVLTAMGLDKGYFGRKSGEKYFREDRLVIF